jgi:hypothetical protein
MTSKDLKLMKQNAAGKRKCITLTVPQNLEMAGGLKVVKAAAWLWQHTALYCQLSMISCASQI